MITRCVLVMLVATGIVVAGPVKALTAPAQIVCRAAPVPRNSTVTLIAPRIAINGLPMAIVQASSPLSPKAFLQFYAKAWVGEDGKPRYVHYPLGSWKVIAHGDRDGCFYTVQVRPQGARTVALIGVSMPGRSSASASNLNVTAPGDARVLTHMVSEDGGKLGDTWLLYTANPPVTVAHFYTQMLKAQGWVRLMQQRTPGSGVQIVQMYQKGSSDMGLVVQPMHNGSTITLTVERR